MKPPMRDMSKRSYRVNRVFVKGGESEVTLTPFDSDTDKVELYYSSEGMTQEHYIVCEADYPDSPIRKYDGTRKTGSDFERYAVSDYELDANSGDDHVTLRKKTAGMTAHNLGMGRGDYNE